MNSQIKFGCLVVLIANEKAHLNLNFKQVNLDALIEKKLVTGGEKF